RPASLSDSFTGDPASAWRRASRSRSSAAAGAPITPRRVGDIPTPGGGPVGGAGERIWAAKSPGHAPWAGIGRLRNSCNLKRPVYSWRTTHRHPHKWLYTTYGRARLRQERSFA